jgi:hypothetical protein
MTDFHLANKHYFVLCKAVAVRDFVKEDLLWGMPLRGLTVYRNYNLGVLKINNHQQHLSAVKPVQQ